MQLQTLVDRLDDRLETGAYSEVDASANSLQVGPATATVEHAAFAVDAAVATIDEAAAAGADVLVTHHGLSWGGIEHVTGRTYDRIAALVDADLSLYVSHLPLDGHQTLGNAAGVADALGLSEREPFGTLGPVTIGTVGETREPLSTETICGRLNAFEGQIGETRALAFGPDTIERVAVVTGSGTDWLEEADAVGADALITGEGKQQAYHTAREGGLTVFLAGHYATETFGVRSLQTLVEDWGLETTFVSHPTGL
jgi:dinuclear metal center YbgI/SA1388 family protein